MSDVKFTRVFKTPETTQTWYYDFSIFRNGPVKVEIEYHDGLQEWKPKAKKPAKAPKRKKAAKAKTVTAKPKRKKAQKNVSKWFDL